MALRHEYGRPSLSQVAPEWQALATVFLLCGWCSSVGLTEECGGWLSWRCWSRSSPCAPRAHESACLIQTRATAKGATGSTRPGRQAAAQKAATRTIMARMMARTLRGGSRRMSCCTRVSGKAGVRRGTWCGHAPLCREGRLPQACTTPRHQKMPRGGRTISSTRPATWGRALHALYATATTSGARGTGIGCTELARPFSTLSSRVSSHLTLARVRGCPCMRL